MMIARGWSYIVSPSPIAHHPQSLQLAPPGATTQRESLIRLLDPLRLKMRPPDSLATHHPNQPLQSPSALTNPQTFQRQYRLCKMAGESGNMTRQIAACSELMKNQM
jgi:hypothetical protein